MHFPDLGKQPFHLLKRGPATSRYRYEYLPSKRLYGLHASPKLLDLGKAIGFKLYLAVLLIVDPPSQVLRRP